MPIDDPGPTTDPGIGPPQNTDPGVQMRTISGLPGWGQAVVLLGSALAAAAGGGAFGVNSAAEDIAVIQADITHLREDFAEMRDENRKTDDILRDIQISLGPGVPR